MSLSKEVGLGPGHTVLDGDPVGTQRPPQQRLPTFRPLWPNGRPSQQLLSNCFFSHYFYCSTRTEELLGVVYDHSLRSVYITACDVDITILVCRLRCF